MAESYTDVLAWLYGLEAAKGMDFKLERVVLALRSLGDPQRRFASIHVGGTNGKGSVAAMLVSVLRAAGRRVGLYTSPHLVRFTERIRIGDMEIDPEEVVALTREIRTAATARGIELTFFEFVTVMAFLHFARGEVDLAVVEVGLGGRLDATNVLIPAVSVITTIGLDHEEFLGSTIESVAAEKAGIIKEGRPVVVGDVPEEAGVVFARTAASKGAALLRFAREFGRSEGEPFDIWCGSRRIGDLEIGLLGAYQRDNAATAVAALLQLPDEFAVTDEQIRTGLETVEWPGRLEVVSRNPLVILDGAHNPDGTARLVREIPAVIGNRRLHVLFGVMRDKRWDPMVASLGSLIDSAVVTIPHESRGEAPEAVAAGFARYCPVRIARNPQAGLQWLLGSARSSDAILVTGSLYLVGAVYPYFESRHGRSGHCAVGEELRQA